MLIFAHNRSQRVPYILTSVRCESGLTDLYHIRLTQIMFSTPNYGWQWFLYIMYSGCLSVSFTISNRNHVRFYHTVTVFSGNCRHWLPNIIRSTLTSMITLNDKRLWIIQNEFF